jgi:hypothetical protein
MSATRSRAERLVALSLAIYEALLLLYPRRFRHVYASDMAQVFRDSLRAATRQGGIAGLARVWRVTLGDLVVTALAERTERMEQDMKIARSALYRAAGLISLLGVAVWILGLAWLTLDTMLFSQPLAPITFILLQAKWGFFAIGFIGLFAWLSARRGALVWLPGVVALAALLVMLAGGLYWNWASQVLVGAIQTGSVQVVNLAATSAVNQQVDYYAYAAMNLGFPVLGLALLVAGWMIRATPGLRGASRALLLMGAISAVYYFFTDMGAPSLLRNTGMPGILGMLAGMLVFTAVWLGGWALLGRQLWQAGAAQEQAAVVAG